MGPKIAALAVAHAGRRMPRPAGHVLRHRQADPPVAPGDRRDVRPGGRRGAGARPQGRKTLRLEAMSSQPSIADALRELWSQISVLAVSGLAGAAFRAILAPERKWKRRHHPRRRRRHLGGVSRRHPRPHARQPDRRRLLRLFRRRLHHGIGRRGRRQGAAGPLPGGRQMSWPRVLQWPSVERTARGSANRCE